MARRRLPASLDPLRKLLRDKLIRVVDEVVARYHREQLELLRDELRVNREQLSRLLTEFEHRSRRDLMAAGERVAVATSADFARTHMPTAPALPDLTATLEYGLKLAPSDGLALEFGVWSGSTLRTIASSRGGRDVYGFDSFEGLPESWRTGFPAGTFPIDGPPQVPGAQMVVGLFADSLPKFMAKHTDRPVAFVHIDCDLYSSTVTVLEHVGPRLREGSVLVFDEYFNYPGWQEHEHRAWSEYVANSGLKFTYEGYTQDHEQVVVRVTAV